MDLLAERALTVTLAVSLGQIRTLIEHPASMTHATVPVVVVRGQFGTEESPIVVGGAPATATAMPMTTGTNTAEI